MPPPAERAADRHPIRSALVGDLRELLVARLDRLDWSDAQRAGRALGALAWRLARRDRRRALEHLLVAFPELAATERERLGRASFLHLGTVLAESLWLASRDAGEVLRRVAFDGWEEVERARAAGRPILILSGHCGNWELLAAALNARGLGMAVVARELDDPGLQGALLDLRARFGTRTIVRGTPGAARELLRTLRSGRALGMLIDQDTKVEGVWVDFFGRPAWTPSGAADIAARFGAAVLPSFVERLPDGSHRARIAPALELPAETAAATQRMSDAIEAQIRRVPAQWVWMHRRWRRQPASGAARAQ
ncbi:MAG: lysophospholipid acyltransferase family protein [Thermoanaerobaculia bacterium]|nr:lysophospholipid acyltransferase family protein [Thermoanaerobaculia bacterium]